MSYNLLIEKRLAQCAESRKGQYFTSADLASAAGQTRRVIQQYLKEKFPDHEARTWWRFDEAEFAMLLCDVIDPTTNRRTCGSRKRIYQKRPKQATSLSMF